MSYFLAVDAGGTKTDYLLADETRGIAWARSGSIKRMRVSEATAEENLREGLESLATQSGVDLSQVNASCVGAAGSTVPLVSDWLRKAFRQHVGGELVLVEDVEIALDAAFFGGPGVLVLAGTGSNIAGRGSDGVLTTAGGWGPSISDRGSGYSLGHAALQECFLALDEGRETLMMNEILSFWNLPNSDSLVEFANATPRPDMSKLSVLVGPCAAAGDISARRVIEQEAAALAHLASVVIARLRQKHAGVDCEMPVAFAGSILEHFPEMRKAVADYISESNPDIKMVTDIVSPIEGALWRARLRTRVHAGIEDW